MFGILTLQAHCFSQIFKETNLFNNFEKYLACATWLLCNECVMSMSTVCFQRVFRP